MTIKNIFKTFCTSLLIACSFHVFADVQTDHLITQNVKAKIASDPSVSSANILVKTVDGVVMLNGLVDTQTQKDTAYKMAGSVQNVLKVESNISVRTASETNNGGTAQASSSDQGTAANTTNSKPNTQSNEKTTTNTQTGTASTSTADSSTPVTIPPPPPNPNYNPVLPNYPTSAPAPAPTNATFGTSSNQSP